jgi:hypothetical protein
VLGQVEHCMFGLALDVVRLLLGFASGDVAWPGGCLVLACACSPLSCSLLSTTDCWGTAHRAGGVVAVAANLQAMGGSIDRCVVLGFGQLPTAAVYERVLTLCLGFYVHSAILWLAARQASIGHMVIQWACVSCWGLVGVGCLAYVCCSFSVWDVCVQLTPVQDKQCGFAICGMWNLLMFWEGCMKEPVQQDPS